MKILLYAALLFCRIASLAQSFPQVPLNLGSTFQQVAALYGDPVGFFWRGQFYTTAPETQERVYVVYRHEEERNEYEFRISYAPDISQSNLHPTLRIDAVVMLTDKPVKVREGLLRMPGAYEFCRPECMVRRLVPGQSVLLKRRGDRDFVTPAIQAFMRTPDGLPTPNTMHDLDSFANCFILDTIDFSNLPLTRDAKQKW